MSGPGARRRRSSTLMRWVLGFLPPPGGGQPPAVVAARASLSGWVVTTIALVVGAAAGFVLVLLAMAMPHVPSLVVGFAGGALVGASVTAMLASRYPIVRRGGGLAILLAPLLVLAAPFLLIAAAIALLRKTSPAPRRPEADAPERVIVEAAPRRAHHRPS